MIAEAAAAAIQHAAMLDDPDEAFLAVDDVLSAVWQQRHGAGGAGGMSETVRLLLLLAGREQRQW